jgi:serine/threonine protein kinase
MEYCDCSLRSYLNKVGSQLPSGEQLRIGTEIAEGLQILHQHEIIHRDLKADNVLLKIEAGQYCVKLTDFGTARSMTTGAIATIGSVGTPGFMAPELFEDRGYHLSPAIDIFSWAMTMLEILDPTYVFARDPAAGGIPAELQKLNPQEFARRLLVRWQELITRPKQQQQQEQYSASAHGTAASSEDTVTETMGRWRPELPDDPLSEALRPLINECWHAKPRRRPSARLIRIFLEAMTNNPAVNPPSTP